MAVEQTVFCDSCRKKNSTRIPVLHIELKRSDGKRTTGDLCVTCVSKLEDDFNLTTTAKRRHATFKIVDVKDIPGHK